MTQASNYCCVMKNIHVEQSYIERTSLEKPWLMEVADMYC